MLRNYNEPAFARSLSAGLNSASSWRRAVCGSVFFALFAGLTGCSTVPKLAEDRAFWEALVAERAKARWQLVIENKYAEAYQFFSEASRQGLTVETFERQMRSVGVKSVTVKSVQCGAERCQANLETVVEYAIPRIGRRSMPLPVDEVWVVSNKDAHIVRR